LWTKCLHHKANFLLEYKKAFKMFVTICNSYNTRIITRK